MQHLVHEYESELCVNFIEFPPERLNLPLHAVVTSLVGDGAFNCDMGGFGGSVPRLTD